MAHWLQSLGWTILARGWHCRWGELDLIAQQQQPPQTVAFVEVKTRRPGNWDADGLGAITPQKQAKLWKTAQLFLAQSPDLASYPCRFDVALVQYRREKFSSDASPSTLPVPPLLRQPVTWQGCELSLQTYLESAFEL